MDATKIILGLVRQHGNADLKIYKQLGDITVNESRESNLLIFNYNNAAQHNRRWNKYERACRGLVIDYKHNRVVGRGFDKFFNLNEMPESSVDEINKLRSLGEIEFTHKMDGSLGISYWDEVKKEHCITTRGMFNTPQGQWATQFLHEHTNYRALPPHVSLSCEIIYPKNKIVVDYGSLKDLILIGMRDTQTGEDYPYAALTEWARILGMSLVKREDDMTSLEQLIESSKDVTGIEGWVGRCANGFRFKIKTEEYRKLHYQTFAQCPGVQKIRTALLEDRIDEYYKILPPTAAQRLRDSVHFIENHITEQMFAACAMYAELPFNEHMTRKEKAIYIHKHCGNNANKMTILLSGKGLRRHLLVNLDINDIYDGLAQIGLSDLLEPPDENSLSV